MTEQQPLLNNENVKIEINNYDSIAYTSLNDTSSAPIENNQENDDGCTPFQASFNTINLLGKV